mgnify:CR=1 FL=1
MNASVDHDDQLRSFSFPVALLIQRSAARMEEGLLEPSDQGLIDDAELLAGSDAQAVTRTVDNFQGALRALRRDRADRLERLRAITCRARLRAFVARRRCGEPVTMADL